jgi:hypothetical protein
MFFLMADHSPQSVPLQDSFAGGGAGRRRRGGGERKRGRDGKKELRTPRRTLFCQPQNLQE